MSIFSIIVAFLFLSMHACNARHGGFAFDPHAKDVEKEQLHEKEIKGLPLFNTKETTLGGQATSMATLDENQKDEKIQNLKGKARKMLESAPQKTKEDTHEVAKERDGPVEDTLDMDYVQPHHASPIHNLH